MNTIKDIVVEYKKRKAIKNPYVSLADLMEAWKKKNAS